MANIGSQEEAIAFEKFQKSSSKLRSNRMLTELQMDTIKYNLPSIPQEIKVDPRLQGDRYLDSSESSLAFLVNKTLGEEHKR